MVEAPSAHQRLPLTGTWHPTPLCVAAHRRWRGTAARLAHALGLWLLALGAWGCASLSEPGAPLPGLEPLVARAEAARGLRFAEPVEVRVLAPETVAARLAREIDRVASAEEIAAQSELAAAVGLVPPGTDLREEMLHMQAGSVAGFFTPVDRTLYVVADAEGTLPTSPGFQSVVVHELVHALQAVHSPLPDLTLGVLDHDDLNFALAAVLEGDATWAMLRDESLQDGLAQRQVSEVAAGNGELLAEAEALGAPRWLRETFLQPYPLGYALAVSRAEGAGTAGLDALLAEPPLSSHALLNAEAGPGLTWLPLDARGVAPDVACTRSAANTFGALGLRVALLESGAPAVAADAAAGAWVADRAMRLACPHGPATVWLVQLDDAAAAAALAREARALAASRGLRIDSAGQRVLLSAGIEPGGRQRLLELEARHFEDLDAYLAARPEIPARVRRVREDSWLPAVLLRLVGAIGASGENGHQGGG